MASEPIRLDLYIHSSLDVRERSHLIAKLEHERGIARAWFDADPHRLVVYYLPDHFSIATLLDLMREEGCEARVMD